MSNQLKTMIALATLTAVTGLVFPASWKRRGNRPCRVCGKADVKAWRERGVDLCAACEAVERKEGS